jgi:hypothetical protein
MSKAQGHGPIPGRPCIFCGSTGVTKQHVWSEWIGKVMLPAQTKYQHVRTYGDHMLHASSVTLHSPQVKQGPLWSLKMRNVCRTCNGGWMSRLEERVKTFLAPMILGDDRALSEAEMKDLSAWACLTTIMAEFIDPNTLAIPPAHRIALRQTVEPPGEWYIFIGEYEGAEWDIHYRHFGLHVSTSYLVQIPYNKPEKNTVITTFTVGAVMFHVFASTILGLITLSEEDVSSGVRRIWPSPRAVENWKTGIVLGDDDVSRIADRYFIEVVANPYPS